MTWARALGEFGATITVCRQFPGPHTDHATGYLRRPARDLSGALTLASILLVVSFCLLAVVRLLTGRGVPDA